MGKNKGKKERWLSLTCHTQGRFLSLGALTANVGTVRPTWFTTRRPAIGVQLSTCWSWPGMSVLFNQVYNAAWAAPWKQRNTHTIQWFPLDQVNPQWSHRNSGSVICIFGKYQTLNIKLKTKSCNGIKEVPYFLSNFGHYPDHFKQPTCICS